MLFYRVLLYGLIFFLPFIFIFKSYYQVGALPQEKVLWYQDFKSNPKFNQDLSVKEFPKFKRNYYQDSRLLAYFTPNGEISHKVFIDRQSVASVRNKGYVIFQKFGYKLDYYDSLGQIKWSYNGYSYPTLSPQFNNIFLVTTDNTIVSMMDFNQKEIIPPTYLGTFISDIAFCPFNENVGVGTIDGKVFFFGGEKGDEKFEYKFTGSKYNYVKSLTCSSSGNRLLVLHSLHPEKLTLFDGLGRLLWEQETGVARRTKTTLMMDEKNNLIYDEREGEVNLLDLTTGATVKKIASDFNPDYTLFSSSLNYLLVAKNTDERQLVSLYHLDTGKLEWERSYQGTPLRYVELERKGKELNLLIILDGLIYAYQLNNMLL